MNNKKIDLKQIRKNQRLTQDEFSEVLDVSRSTITKIEGGQLELSKNMIKKLMKNFPMEFGLPIVEPNLIGNTENSEILINVISTNLGSIEFAKQVIKKMCLTSKLPYNKQKLTKFLKTSNKLNFVENLAIYESADKYSHKILLDFVKVSKECLYSIYEDLFNLCCVVYLYSDDNRTLLDFGSADDWSE